MAESTNLLEEYDRTLSISSLTSSAETTSVNRRLSRYSSEELSKEELVSKLKQYRKSNIELLEDKRHLLLKTQEAKKLEMEHEVTKEELHEIRKRVKALENPSVNTAEKLATNAIKAIVRQLSNTSQKPLEEQEKIEEEKVEVSHAAEEFFTDAEPKRKESLHLPLKKMHEEDNTICCCGSAEQLKEVIKINHFWQKDYSLLMDESNKLKARLWRAESELHMQKQENEELLKTIEKEGCQPISPASPTLEETNQFTLDDIEALKQQLVIYKEDYTAEKEDNKKLSEEHNKLKLELQKAYGVIDQLTVKNYTIKENYRRVSSEKEHIVNELRRLSTSSLPFSPVRHSRRLPSNESLDTLRTEDVIPHSGSSIHLPASFYNGNIVRDGRYINNRSPPLAGSHSPPLLGRSSSSSSDVITGRTSPTNQQGRTSPNALLGRSSPTTHIKFKELTNVNEDMNSL